jgi:hypothetical protein
MMIINVYRHNELTALFQQLRKYENIPSLGAFISFLSRTLVKVIHVQFVFKGKSITAN